jgi:hypothetical protein
LTQENIAILQHECPDVTFVVQNEQVEQRHMSASEEQQLAESAACIAAFLVANSPLVVFLFYCNYCRK